MKNFMSPERFRIKNVSVKSVLAKSNLPDTDFVINPYISCKLSCAYCYASFVGRSVNEGVS
jgi:DNA repair photolyase